ncbi:MAG: lysine--tRNA ligase, partial [Verrucomicrobiota bacterium]|nr:lysine--tRNA ligase [Verrucomicrobiota bacterium]
MTDTNDNQDNTHDLYAVRLQKLENLCAAGRNPFAANFKKMHATAEAIAAYDESLEDSDQALVNVAGRIVVFRLMGKASFIKIQDSAGQI